MAHALSITLLLTLPFQFALPALFGWEIPLTRLLAVALILLYIVGALLRRSCHLPGALLSGALISLLGISVASLLWAARPDLALPKIIFLFNLIPLAFVWHDVFRREPLRLGSLVQALILGALGSAIAGLIIFFPQFIFGVSDVFHFMIERVLPFFLGEELSTLVASYPSLLVNVDGQTLLRATAFFPDPHVASFFFGMCGFLALGWARKSGRRLYRIAATLLFLADILSFSRGGYVGLVAGGLVYAASSIPNLSPRYILRFGAATLASGILLAIFGAPVVSRFATSFSVADTSSAERLVLWREAVVTIAERPILGVGIGNYLSSARPLYQAGTPFYAHNLYLDIAVELGIVGLGVLLAALLPPLWKFFRRHGRHPAAPAFASTLTLYLTHSVFETALFSLHITTLLVFVLAAASALEAEEA